MELTYPQGLVYLIVLFFFVLLSAGLAAKVTVQKQEIKDLLGRRDRKDKPKTKQQAENNCRECIQNFHYENILIPELHSEVEYWKQAFKSEQRCNALMHSEIAKLRTNKENGNEA